MYNMKPKCNDSNQPLLYLGECRAGSDFPGSCAQQPEPGHSFLLDTLDTL